MTRGVIPMKGTFEGFLIEQNLLPLSEENWDVISINHSEGSDQVGENKNVRTKLSNSKYGVYIYTNKNGDVYYVGEGNFIERFIRHYKKSYENRVKGSPRYRFFNKHKEEMIVYYKEFVSKNDGLPIEAMLITVLEPEYNKWLKQNKDQ